MSARLIIIVIMFAAALLTGFFLAWPEFQKLQQVQYELEQKKAELDSKTSYYSEIKNIWGRLEEHQDSLSQIEKAVSKGYSLPVLFDYLQGLAGETGLVLEDLTFGSASGEDIKEISFNLGVSGAYSSFKSFLKALEQSAKLFNVKSISFSSPEEEEEVFSFKMTVATYSY